VTAPVLVLHGELDEIIPIQYGRRLYELAHDPKRFMSFPKGGHLDLDDHGALTVVREFVTHLPTAASQAIDLKGPVSYSANQSRHSMVVDAARGCPGSLEWLEIRRAGVRGWPRATSVSAGNCVENTCVSITTFAAAPGREARR
jgi:hypothetical protein